MIISNDESDDSVSFLTVPPAQEQCLDVPALSAFNPDRLCGLAKAGNNNSP